MGVVMALVNNNRGLATGTSYLDERLVIVPFEAPLSKVLTGFYDQLKSVTSGYGSFSYELEEYRPGELVKLDVLVAGEAVPSLSTIVHKDEAQAIARSLASRLKELIPRQLFEVSLQVAVGGKILAREDVKPLGKNVTAHLYGGDITRKRKLWEKQKAGKKRMKKIGKIDIPPEAFMAMLRKE
jgi:GTP-binding protein LepA